MDSNLVLTILLLKMKIKFRFIPPILFSKEYIRELGSSKKREYIRSIKIIRSFKYKSHGNLLASKSCGFDDFSNDNRPIIL